MEQANVNVPSDLENQDANVGIVGGQDGNSDSIVVHPLGSIHPQPESVDASSHCEHENVNPGGVGGQVGQMESVVVGSIDLQPGTVRMFSWLKKLLCFYKILYF